MREPLACWQVSRLAARREQRGIPSSRAAYGCGSAPESDRLPLFAGVWCCARRSDHGQPPRVKDSGTFPTQVVSPGIGRCQHEE